MNESTPVDSIQAEVRTGSESKTRYKQIVGRSVRGSFRLSLDKSLAMTLSWIEWKRK
jgi:hypothetical protein